MKKYCSIFLIMFSITIATNHYQDGVLISTTQDLPTSIPNPTRQFLVVDSFPAGAINYSVGLACDGQYIWNNEAFSHWFARMDTATGAIINSFNTTLGNRDMTFDGQYLWASDWQTSSINQFDTSDCSLLNTYYPPFSAGRPNGMAWDGTFLWVGEESGRIYKMTTTGDTIRSIPPPVYYSYDPRGLAFDGQHLWVAYQSSGLIYEVDTTDGSVIASYPAPGHVAGSRFQQGLACDGHFLWSTVGGNAQVIYQIDIGLQGSQEYKNQLPPTIKLVAAPNPFIRETEISFVLNTVTNVKLSIIDVTGRVVTTLVNEKPLASGEYRFRWQAENQKNGVYFIVLSTNGKKSSIKVIKI